MAKTGDYYDVSLSESHLGWGTHRYTNSRPRIEGERYIPIPRGDARRLSILNSNATAGQDVPGQNIFFCSSADGTFHAVMKAQGCSHEGDPYAKQFSVNDDLQALSEWYNYIDAQVGDIIRVEWISSTEIIIDRIDRNG